MNRFNRVVATSLLVAFGMSYVAMANVTTDPITNGASKDVSITKVESAPGTPQTTAVTIQGNASAVPVPVSGTLTATNPSVGATGSAPPTSATLGGGSVTTAAPTYTTGQMDPLSLTTAGGLRVDGSGTTQPISAAALPLPTGASTAAKQPALGTAGTPSADVISIQGVAGGTVIPVSAASLPLPTGASTATNQTNVQSAPGTPQTVAITIQGNASGVAVPVTGSVIATAQTVATTTISRVNNATSSTSLLASNAARKGMFFYNDSVTDCNVALAGTASATVFSFKLTAGSHFTWPDASLMYTGAVSVICTLASGAVQATEF